MTDFMKKEIGIYKALRGHISEGKVYHLSPPPDGTFNDYLQSHHEATGKSVIFVFRQETAYDHEVVRPRGLNEQRTYRVRFQDSDRTYTASGRQIMEEGVIVELPSQYFAEIVYIDPLQPYILAGHGTTGIADRTHRRRGAGAGVETAVQREEPGWLGGAR
jgi:alpha-galactosidase